MSIIRLVVAAMCSSAAVTSGLISALQKHWNIGVCLEDGESILLSLTRALPVRAVQHPLGSAHWKFEMKQCRLELSIWGNSGIRFGEFL